MVQEEQQEEEQELGGSWRELFQHDPAALYEYGDRAYEELGEALEYINQIQDPQLQVRSSRQRRLAGLHAEDMGGMAACMCACVCATGRAYTCWAWMHGRSRLPPTADMGACTWRCLHMAPGHRVQPYEGDQMSAPWLVPHVTHTTYSTTHSIPCCSLATHAW